MNSESETDLSFCATKLWCTQRLCCAQEQTLLLHEGTTGGEDRGAGSLSHKFLAGHSTRNNFPYSTASKGHF